MRFSQQFIAIQICQIVALSKCVGTDRTFSRHQSSPDRERGFGTHSHMLSRITVIIM
jgi:hypothetical protein